MNWLLLSAGFMMGLLGSPHCLGMCGGIVSAFGISMQGVSPQKKAWLVAIYHMGRLISYMTLGVAAGVLGATILSPFMGSTMPRILLGIAIIFASLLMLGLPILNNIEKLGLGLWAKLAPVRAKVFPLTTPPKALGAGLLWGFLPCGLVYGAVGVAIATGADESTNIANSMLFMLAFGLGTLPMLVATQSVVELLQRTIKKFSLRKASGVLMLISGLFVAAPAMMHSHHDHSHHDHSHQAQHEHNHHHEHEHHNHDGHHDHHNHTHHNH